MVFVERARAIRFDVNGDAYSGGRGIPCYGCEVLWTLV
jgi:hypothetical protein